MLRRYSRNSASATVAAKVTVADESSDTTCFVTFVTAATGDLPVKSGTNLTFNSNTGALTATSFVGPASQVTAADESADTTCFPLFVTAATGALPPKTGTNLAFNSNTGELTATLFKGALNGTLGATTPAAIAGTTGAFSDDFSVAATKKIYLDGGGDSYFYEVSADRIDYIVGGWSTFIMNGLGSQIQLKPGGTTSLTLAGANATVAGTLTSTGDFNCNSKFNVTASTGALLLDGTINTLTVGLGASSVATNTAIGVGTLAAISSGDNNVAVGYQALNAGITSANSVAIGYQSLLIDQDGQNNIAIGLWALKNATSPENSVAIGRSTLLSSVTGEGNVALGHYAGAYELGSDAFYVDNQNRTNTAGDKAGAILYGVFNATPASQTLTANAALTVAQTLEWGSGASIASSDNVRIRDYAGIEQHDNTNATAVEAKEIPMMIDDFSVNMPEVDSNGDYTNNQITVGATDDYKIEVSGAFSCAAVNKECEVVGYEISSTTQAIEGISEADPCVMTITGHGYSGGETIYADGAVGGMTEVRNQIFDVVYIGVDTFSLDAQDGTDVNSGAYTTFTSGGTVALATKLAHGCQECVSANKLYNFAGHVIASLTEGYILKAFVLNEDSADAVTVKYCDFSINRV